MKKALFIVVLVTIWILVYYTSNFIVTGSEFYNYATPIDDAFPLIPLFSIFYIAIFPILLIPFTVIKNKKAIMAGFLAIITITLPFFLIFPGEMIRPEFQVTGLFTWILAMVYKSDLPHNLFPSLHASISMFAALGYHKKWFYGFLFLVALSCIFTKQHNFLDIIAGLIVGAIGYEFYKNVTSNPSPTLFY